jgi:osmotically-inducible protein OsmY
MDSDARLQQAIVDELASDGNLDTATIGVSVQNGVVRLFGTVPTIADLSEAQTRVRNLPGVVQVIDELRVPRELR